MKNKKQYSFMFGRRLTMKKSALNIWCDRLWLYFIYLSGIVMLNILIVGWNDMLTAQKITCRSGSANLIPVANGRGLPCRLFTVWNFTNDGPCDEHPIPDTMTVSLCSKPTLSIARSSAPSAIPFPQPGHQKCGFPDGRRYFSCDAILIPPC